ncbi:MAG TPA: nucleoside hydrolase [Dermatophilaceae bacterium]|nr:nucleoside hydrolase [Dermatophilaceae bacterium]
MTRPVLLDCDTGTDDAVAIMMAALCPQLHLLGVSTVWGNQDVADTTANTLAVLEHVGRADVPVFRGLAGPRAPRLVPLPPYAAPHRLPLPAAAGREQDMPAVDWLVARMRSGGLTVVATGPLTNLAAAVAADPGAVAGVAELVVLGGAHAVGNVTPSADRNFWNDPAAAAAVLAAPWRRLVLLTLDATYGAPFTAPQGAALAALGTPAAVAAATLLAERITSYSQVPGMRERTAAPVHDALAVAYLMDPDVVSLRPVHVAVETQGRLTYGRSVLDLDGITGGPPNAHVALRADGERFFHLVCGALGRRAGG